ncbi:tetraspanin-14-like [Pomacea canaliculata]|uniref:tetraspanin-14-like n=1 Tax=Pomacea canaliculata TaxID=400727 RepID=UPI000D735C5C|nr:tetraspanin-14-like [Pomacea canaliculata]
MYDNRRMSLIRRASLLIPRIKKNFVCLPLKYILFSANFASWVLGVVILGFGVWELMVSETIFNGGQLYKIDYVIHFLSAVTIITGFFLFIISFTGCIGALRENICLLKFYYRALLIVLMVEVSGAVALLALRAFFVHFLEWSVTKYLIQNYEEDKNAKFIVNVLQRQLHCCGITSQGFTDWNLNAYYNCSDANISVLKCSVPYTCCKRPDTIKHGVANIFCGKEVLHYQAVHASSKIFTEGCLSRLKTFTVKNLPIFVSIILIIVIIQVLAIIMTRRLKQQIKQQMRQWTVRHKEMPMRAFT